MKQIVAMLLLFLAVPLPAAFLALALIEAGWFDWLGWPWRNAGFLAVMLPALWLWSKAGERLA